MPRTLFAVHAVVEPQAVFDRPCPEWVDRNVGNGHRRRSQLAPHPGEAEAALHVNAAVRCRVEMANFIAISNLENAYVEAQDFEVQT